MSDSPRVETLEAHDGMQLSCEVYRGQNPVKATLLMVHDFGEHAGVYRSLYSLLNQQHFSVCALDLRGHGQSPGERGSIDAFESYLEDLDLLLARVKDQEEQAIFILGQGIGALIAARFAISRRPRIQGLILSGLVTDLPLSSMHRAMAHVDFARNLLAHVKIDQETRDMLLKPALEGVLKDDASAFRGELKLKTVREFLGAMQILQQENPILSFPVLILQGSDDPCLRAVLKFHDALMALEKELLTYPHNNQHILLEYDRFAIHHDIVEWCEKQCAQGLVNDGDEDEDDENQLLNDSL